MTSQQAITLLRNLEQSLDDYCELNDEGKAAFNKAITALELFGNSERLPSAQPELCSDCIANGGDWECDHMHCRKGRLPSAQPERKKGKWVGYDGDWLKTMCKCSECGAMIDINEKYRNFFCYHCGARMDDGQDE